MMTKRIAALSAIAALGLGVLVAGDQSAEAGAKAAPPKKTATDAGAPTTEKPVALQPKEMVWGIDKKKLGQIYDKVIERDYQPRYKRTQPGPALDALDAEVAEKKAEFRRNVVDFGTVATGWDSSPLAGEYTYGNKESMMWIDRAGKTRYFFFIQEKLWKVVDAIKLGPKSLWGQTFDDALVPFKKAYGVDGRARAADAAQGRPFPERDWKDKDGKALVRAVDWGNDQFAIVFTDPATAAQIDTLRTNKKGLSGGVDAGVKDAARGDKK